MACSPRPLLVRARARNPMHTPAPRTSTRGNTCFCIISNEPTRGLVALGALKQGKAQLYSHRTAADIANQARPSHRAACKVYSMSLHIPQGASSSGSPSKSDKHKNLVVHIQQLLQEQLRKDPTALGLYHLQRLDPQQLLLSESLFQHQAVYLWLNEKLTGLQVGTLCMTILLTQQIGCTLMYFNTYLVITHEDKMIVPCGRFNRIA